MVDVTTNNRINHSVLFALDQIDHLLLSLVQGLALSYVGPLHPLQLNSNSACLGYSDCKNVCDVMV